MPQSTGHFIVLDGPEGAGKSTQVRLLVDRLQRGGADVVAVRDPGATRIGEQIRAILLNPDHLEMNMRAEMLLYMAARAQMMAEVIFPALSAGKIVICDRFVSSTLAYQLGGDGLSEADIRSVAEVSIRSRWPDLTIILDIPPADSFARVKRAKDRIEQRGLEYHQQVRQHFLEQARRDPQRHRIIPADQTIELVHEAICKAVDEVITGRAG